MCQKESRGVFKKDISFSSAGPDKEIERYGFCGQCLHREKREETRGFLDKKRKRAIIV